MSRDFRSFSLCTLLALTVTICVSCTPSKPSTSEARSSFERKLQANLLPPYTIESFTVTNTQSGNIGVEIYGVAFTAVVSYPNDNIKCRQDFCIGLLPGLTLSMDEAQKKATFSGWLHWELTGNGWV